MKQVSAPAPQRGVAYRFPTPPSTQEIAALLAAASKEPEAIDVQDVLIILHSTGMRCNELCDLRWSDVDFEERSIIVNSRKTLQVRRIPITDETTAVLRARHERQPNSDYILGSAPRCLLNRIIRQIDVLCDRIGGHRITLHSLRRAFAARWIASGGSPESLASVMGLSRLGHSSEMSTSRAYLNASRLQAKLES